MLGESERYLFSDDGRQLLNVRVGVVREDMHRLRHPRRSSYVEKLGADVLGKQKSSYQGLNTVAASAWESLRSWESEQ